MCGRFTSTTPRDMPGQVFEALVTDRERAPSYNVSPTSDVYVVLDDGEARKVDLLRWGLVPAWAKDLKIGTVQEATGDHPGREAQAALLPGAARWGVDRPGRVVGGVEGSGPKG
jgi:putative SOS response-associated peptidase YedK